jgi:drug/metabolite transporter (DMT)-like permease
MVFGLVTVVLTLVGWSVTPLFIKHFSHQIDPWTSNGWRYGFAALIWAPYLIYGAKRGKLPPKLMLAALVPGAINSVSQIAFTWAHYKIDPGLLTFGLRAQMVVVAFGAAILFPIERMVIKKPAFLVGLLLVVLGTAGTILFDGDFGAKSNTLGVLLALGAGAGFACYALAVRYFMVGMSPIYSFAAISQYTAGSMVVLMLIFGDKYGVTATALPAEQFMWLLISSIIGIAAGHVLYYISIARLGVAVSTGVIQLQPFVVAILSYIWFDEVLGTSQWIAGGMAVAGAVTMLVVQHITTSRLRKRVGDESMELPADHVAAAAEGENE